jgi:hypothetical protein
MGAALGHRRLAIIDLDTGHQPMTALLRQQVRDQNDRAQAGRAEGKTRGSALSPETPEINSLLKNRASRLFKNSDARRICHVIVSVKRDRRILTSTNTNPCETIERNEAGGLFQQPCKSPTPVRGLKSSVSL